MVWYNTICNIIFNNIIVVKPPYHLQAQRLQLQPPAWLAESPEVVSQVRRQTWCRVNALKVLYGLPRLLWPRKSLGFDDGKFHSMPMSETESCAVHSRQFLNASLTLKIYFPGGGGGCRGSWGSRPDSLVVTVWECVCLVFPLCYLDPTSVGLNRHHPPPVTLISIIRHILVVTPRKNLKYFPSANPISTKDSSQSVTELSS